MTAQESRTVTFSIYRYNPETDAKPYMQDFDFEVPAGKDMIILECLLQLKDQQDESITFRRSCREGVCGSDGMNINGRNGLACITPLSSIKSSKIVLSIAYKRYLPCFYRIQNVRVM